MLNDVDIARPYHLAGCILQYVPVSYDQRFQQKVVTNWLYLSIEIFGDAIHVQYHIYRGVADLYP